MKSWLNFLTPIDGAVFWSGANRQYAYDWARSNGKMTLEMTAAGKYLDELDLFNVNNTYTKTPLKTRIASELWDLASAKFANTAKGVAYNFTNGIPAFNAEFNVVRTWYR